MTKAWIFVSCNSDVVDQIRNPLAAMVYVKKVTRVQGIWDYILELCDSDTKIRMTLFDVKDLYGVQSTQILTEI